VLIEAARTADALRADQYRCDAALLRLVRGDRMGAFAVLDAADGGTTGDCIRLRAELHYDYGDLRVAASLFAALGDPESLSRQADALYLAGDTSAARGIWQQVAGGVVAGPVQASLGYNLAATAENAEEAAGNIRLVLARYPDYPYALVLNSRRMDDGNAVAYLRAAEERLPDPLVQLERLRRGAAGAGLARAWADTWLLLNRYPQDGRLYVWAAWFFASTGRYAEGDRLLAMAETLKINDPGLAWYRAAGALRAGDLDGADKTLREIPAERGDWRVPATRGLIREARRDPAGALTAYELAGALRPGPKEAARLQVHIARCLRMLGRDGDARRSLEYALDLDPENLSARLGLR